MKNSFKLILLISMLVLAALACETVTGGNSGPQSPADDQNNAANSDNVENADLQDEEEQEPTDTPEPTPTVETPEMRNNGINFYTVTAHEQGCLLSLSSPEQYRQIEFVGDQVKVWNNNSEGFETYDSIGQHRYLRYNSVNRPIVVVFSLEGYILEVYDEGDNVDTATPCGYFVFTLGE